MGVYHVRVTQKRRTGQSRRNAQRGEGVHAAPFRRIHSPSRGAHCRPLDPRLASLRSGMVVILENPKLRALDTTAVMGDTFSLLMF